MGWELRRGKPAYYRKVREGRRVRSVYCGGGERGERAAREDAERRARSGASRRAESTGVEAAATDDLVASGNNSVRQVEAVRALTNLGGAAVKSGTARERQGEASAPEQWRPPTPRPETPAETARRLVLLLRWQKEHGRRFGMGR